MLINKELGYFTVREEQVEFHGDGRQKQVCHVRINDVL
jgi:hypothetical protein